MAPISKRKREKTTTISTRRTTATKTTKAAPVTEEISATRRIVTRSIYKKLMNQEEQKRSFLKTLSAVDEQQGGDDDDDDPSTANKGFLDEGCTTPKSEKHKIPEIMTCPPAPKKPRVSPSTSNCILQRRRPISFFAHPDLDKFFMFAMRDIKV